MRDGKVKKIAKLTNQINRAVGNMWHSTNAVMYAKREAVEEYEDNFDKYKSTALDLVLKLQKIIGDDTIDGR